MRLLITGGAGFIGSHFVDLILQRGGDVVIVDDFSSGTPDNVPIHRNVEFVKRNFRACEAQDFTRHFDAIVHLAARPSVRTSWEQPMQAHESNLSLTLHAISLADKLGIKRIVFASSAAVYGDVAEVPTTELSPTVPNSPYGLQKLASEWYGRLFGQARGLSFIALRFFNVFGPRQLQSSPYSGVIAKLVAALQDGRPVNITGDGEQTRDFIYVKDAAAALLAAVTHLNGEMPWLMFNIGTGAATSILDLRREISRFFPDKNCATTFLPAVPGDIRHSAASIRAAAETLNFVPRYTLQEGLAEFVNSAPTS